VDERGYVIEDDLNEVVYIDVFGNKCLDWDCAGLRLDHHCELFRVDLKQLAVENVDLNLHIRPIILQLFALDQKVVVL
jgi:hypothetical protein